MNTPFKKATNEVLEIMPILDPIEETPEDCDEIRGEGEEEQNIKVTLNEKDVFGDIIPPNDVEEEVVEKKTRGKRGLDVKQRKKRVMSDEAKAKLAEAREISLQKRKAIKEEKDLLKLKERTEQKVIADEKRTLINVKQQEDQEQKFFNLMEKWSARKSGIKKKKKELAKIQEQTQSHPAGRSIPQAQKPKAPENPFDELFNYKSTRSTFW